MSIAALVLGQTTPADSSSGAGIVFAMLLGIAALSIVALTPRGRRSLMPAITILLGLLITYTTVADAFQATISVLTVLGLVIGLTLVLGGFGALREGIAVPPVEGTEPKIEPQPPRITPDGDHRQESGANAPEVH